MVTASACIDCSNALRNDVTRWKTGIDVMLLPLYIVTTERIQKKVYHLVTSIDYQLEPELSAQEKAPPAVVSGPQPVLTWEKLTNLPISVCVYDLNYDAVGPANTHESA